jgi:tRNA dimethylallyltransferase
MIEDGLIDEVKSLYDDGILPHAIGYQELVPYFKGEVSLDTAIEEIKKNTRHLAKRQETWFKNQMKSHFYTVNLDNIDETINDIIKDIDDWRLK